MRANRPRAASIVVCGLGVSPRQDATLESLRSLAACGRVYADLRDRGSRAWLGRALGRVRRPRAAAEVVSAARSGLRVGLAVWGHACHTNALAREVEARARAERVPCRFLGSLSPVSSLLARSPACLGWDRRSYRGISSYALSTFCRDHSVGDRSLPLLIFSETADAGSWRLMLAGLARRYPSAHPVELHRAAGRPIRCRLSALPRRAPRGAVLLMAEPNRG